MAGFPTTCPSCSATLAATRFRCTGCGTAVEGDFAIPALLRLPAADLEFVLRFVKASGSLKDVAAQYGLSYPTVRNRLNQIIAQLDEAEQHDADARHQTMAARRQAILDAIANGTLTVAAAERQLRELVE